VVEHRIVRTGRAWADGLAGAARRRTDLLAVLAIVLVAAGLRLAFLYRAPAFVHGDSVYYYQAGYELARGTGFEVPLHRTPGYPLFLAGVIRLLGEDLQAIAFVQHVLGVLTAVLAYLIGRSVFGRPAGLVAGLLVALSGPLLIYERYLLSEALFTFLLSVAIWLFVRGLRGGARWSIIGAGLALGLASLARPTGQLVLPALWAAVLLQPNGWRRRLAQVGLITLGFVVVAAPTSVWDRMRGGEPVPTLGLFLYDRVAGYNPGFVLPAPDSPAPAAADPRQAAARRLILRLAARSAPRSQARQQLRDTIGLTEAEVARAMRDVGLEIITSQPARHLTGALRDYGTIMIGKPEQLTSHWIVSRQWREPWQANPSVAHALRPLTEAHRREQPATEALLRIFQPAQHSVILGALSFLGLAAAAVRPANRPALVLALATLAVVLPSAVLVGPVLRFRYPVDPLLAVLVGGGLMAMLAMGAELGGRLEARRRPHSRGDAGALRRVEPPHRPLDPGPIVQVHPE